MPIPRVAGLAPISTFPGLETFKVAYCPDAKTWARLCAALAVENEVHPMTPGHCTLFSNAKWGELCVVTLNLPRRLTADLAAAAAHEAMHAWRALREYIGESEPSDEYEAYSVQHLTSELIRAHCAAKQRGT